MPDLKPHAGGIKPIAPQKDEVCYFSYAFGAKARTIDRSGPREDGAPTLTLPFRPAQRPFEGDIPACRIGGGGGRDHRLDA
jgi:hypothetical protein